MSQDTEYDEAIAYFNRSGKSSADDISYAYDGNKNVLIQHHKTNMSMGGPGAFGLIGGLVSGSIMLNSFHNVATAPTPEISQEAFPDVSIGFSLFFGLFYFGAKSAIKKAVKAVDREVSQSARHQSGPVL